MTCPKVIHQLWIGDESKRPANLMQSWKDMNPSCEYVLWTEEYLSIFGFINQKQIDIMPELNGKCDIMRWEILQRCGGFFADADSLCVNALDDFFFEQDRFACYENHSTSGNLVAMGFVGCSVDDELFKFAVDRIHSKNSFAGPAWVEVGPQLITDIIQEHPELPITIYPSHYFIPEHAHIWKYEGTDKIYSHHYGGSTYNLYGSLK